MIKDQIVSSIAQAAGLSVEDIILDTPSQADHGDYSTNVALKTKGADLKPQENAQRIKENLVNAINLANVVERIEVAGPGFINFYLTKQALSDTLVDINTHKDTFGSSEVLKGKKIMVEFAHPNTHKELHVGHMRTLTVGESLARLFEFNGAKVFRANYQGDIGPHVAKSIWGTTKIIAQRGLSWDAADKLDSYARAHLLGEGYILGSTQYKDDESSKAEIDDLNKKLYVQDPTVWQVYLMTRSWSLDYYDSFYTKFGTKFNKLYFESEVAVLGKKIVLDNTGKVFEKSEGAIIFDGEKYGLHKRVFITKDGNPTYEGKDMGLAPTQFSDFPFDLNVHVVANEQEEYFKVIIKALELIDSKFQGRQFHLSMGMVSLVGKKISSRTGEIITVDGLIDKVKSEVKSLIKADSLTADEVDRIADQVTLAAIKYSVLRTGPRLNVAFDLDQSISVAGDSGPYLQYSAARCASVLTKAGLAENGDHINQLGDQEAILTRKLVHFPEVVQAAAATYSPNLVCNYLFDLAGAFNTYYNHNRIIGSDNQSARLAVTQAVGQTIKNGLYLLGIETPDKM